MLHAYVDSLVDNTKYSITFVIGGVLIENDEFCMVMAYDDHLETMRRRFKIINFEHIYSIQPVKRFDDINNALYLIDGSLENNVSLPSSIKKKEKQNVSITEQNNENNEIEKDIDLSSTAEINLTATKVLNHSNETKVLNNSNKTKAETKLDNTQKKVVFIFNLVFFSLVYYVTVFYRKLEWTYLSIKIKMLKKKKKRKFHQKM